MADWGAWDYGGGNGMRVGFENSMAAVSNGSTSVKLSIEVWTDNQYTYADNGEVMNWGYDFSGTTSTFNNNQGASAVKRFDKSITHTYASTSYGSSPGSFHFSARVSGTYNGVEPRHEMTVAIPARPYATPAAPSTCAAARVSDTSHTVTWNNNATAGKPYSAVWLERYTYGYETWTRVGTLSGSVETYSAATVANRKYGFRVQADNSVGTSGYVQSGDVYTTPAAPTAPVRTQSGTDQVLTWALAVGYTEHATEVWRAVNGTYALLATVASGVTTYTDTTSSSATQVKYKFRTKTTVGTLLNSAYSAETTQTAGVLTAPSAPTLLVPSSGILDPTEAVQHSWKHNPTDTTAQTAYQVQYRYVGDVTWIQTGKITSTASSWTMPANTRAKGRQVEWQVQTWGGSASLASPFSTTATWTTSPIVAVKYPLFLDLTSGRTEADSINKMVMTADALVDGQVPVYRTAAPARFRMETPASPANPFGATELGVVNLDTITVPGLYTQSTNAEAASGTNYPAPLAGLLEVFANTGNTPAPSSFLWQRYSIYRATGASAAYPHAIYVREFYQAVWSSWFRLDQEDTGWIDGGTGASIIVVDSAYITLGGAVARRIGRVCQFNMTCTWKVAVNVPTSGNTTNTTVGQLTAAWRPDQTQPYPAGLEQSLSTVASGRGLSWSITGGGSIKLDAAGGSIDIAIGETVSCAGVYFI